jgi:hypothetical protein
MKTSTRKAAEELYQASGGHGDYPQGSVYAVADAKAGREFQRLVSAGLFTKIDAAPDGARVRGLDVQVMDREATPRTPAPPEHLMRSDIVAQAFKGDGAAFETAVASLGFPQPRLRILLNTWSGQEPAWKAADIARWREAFAVVAAAIGQR